MLFAPLPSLGGPSYFTILGIDPGSTTFGTAALHVDINTLAVAGMEPLTFHGLKPQGGRVLADWMLDLYSERSMRLEELSGMLERQLVLAQPLFVACEAPFFNPRNPNAYQVLVETMKTIENTVRSWNPWRPLYRIETTVAKKAIAPTDVGMAAIAKTIKDAKDKVRYCAQNHPEIAPFIDFNTIDEHSLDAAVVAYAQLLRIRANDFRIVF